MSIPEPNEENDFLAVHAQRLLGCFYQLTGNHLVSPALPVREQARVLFHAPFVVLSHDASADPHLNYANLAGLRLFELTWAELTALPSRLTAEPMHREERARLLARVAERGFIDNYRGVRIARSGRRFHIEKACVWNLFDEHLTRLGQAATFAQWTYLD